MAALGGALAGVGILGAVMSGRLNPLPDSFTRLREALTSTSIGAAPVPVIQYPWRGYVPSSVTNADLYRNAMGIIAKPFELFADTILKAFTFAARCQPLANVANAFAAKILGANNPAHSGNRRKGFADATTKIANAVAANPKAFADFLTFNRGYRQLRS